jgi:8-oxo-dGTP diphosphatase
MVMQVEIEVVAAAVIEERRLLLISKRQAPDVFYLPGGKRDPGEDDLACLRRELEEELGVVPVDPVPWREVVAPAALEPEHSLRMRVFLTRLGGTPAISGELARLRWWDRDDPSRLAPAIEHEVVPQLRAGGLLD